MPRRTAVPPLTSSQAKFILERLIDERVVTAADVRRLLGEMWREMSAVEKRLDELRAAAEPMRHPIRAARKAAASARTAIRRTVSPERRASMRLQGRYLALLRKTRKADRLKFKKLAKQDGREQAIVAMEKALRA